MVPGPTPDVFEEEAGGGLFSFLESGDDRSVLDGRPLLWARRATDSLVAYRLQIVADGGFELLRIVLTPAADRLRSPSSGAWTGCPSLACTVFWTGGAEPVMRLPCHLALVLLLCLTVLPGAVAAQSLTDYFGAFVGRAEVRDSGAGVVETRDMDIEIGPFHRTGFRLRWTNVTLVDGRRDVPGVKRRVNEVTFEPRDGTSLFVEAPIASLFQRQEEASPLAGDPVRWAKLDENGMHVFSFAILEDGRYELQTYSRRLVDDGLELTFERVVDGEPLRRIDGWAVRAD